jgi:outer membrane protein assembly factor BamB
VLGIEIKSSPAVGADGTVYFGSRDRKFYAVSAAGKLKWSVTTGGWVDSSAALAADGSIYFGSWDKHLYALRPDGGKKWEFASQGIITSSPAIDGGGEIYFGAHDGKLYALGADGTAHWSFTTGGAILSSPALDPGGTVYFTSIDGHLYALGTDGKLKWKLRTGGVGESSPVLAEDGTVYVGVNEKVMAVDAEGKKLWERLAVADSLQPVEATPLMLSGGGLAFVSRYGLLTVLDASRNPKGTHYLYVHGGSTPAVAADGTIYTFAHREGIGYFIRAVKSGTPLGKTAWPRFRCTPDNAGRLTGGKT